MAALLLPESIRRLATVPVTRFDAGSASPTPGVLDVDEARARVIARWGGDLCGLLNAMQRSELAQLADRLGARGGAGTAQLRADSSECGPGGRTGWRSPALRI